MAVIVLIRHGESESNILHLLDDNINSKYRLTETGRGQVQYVADQLEGIKFDGIISSPILRTRETAEIIAGKLNLKYTVDQRLTESGQGPFSGKVYDTLQPVPRDHAGQEPWEHIIERFQSIFSELNGRYLLVSHALPIKAIVSNYLGLPDESSSFGIDIKLASISAIDLRAKQVICAGSLVLTKKARDLIVESEK